MLRFCVSLLLLAIALPAAGQTVSTWVAAVDGDWSDASKWSTNPIMPVGPEQQALINAMGAPYTIDVNYGLLTDQITLDSPDATVLLNSGVQLNNASGIEVNQGQLVLGYGSVANTRLSGAAGVRTGHISAFGVPNVTGLRGVTLATTLKPIVGGSFNYLRVYDDLTLEDGTVYLQSDETGGSRSFLQLMEGSSLAGTGEIVVSQAEVTDPFVSVSPDAYLYIDGSDSHIEQIEAGVTVRAERGAQLTIDDIGATASIESFHNYGTIEAVGGVVRMNYNVAFRNYGTMRAVDGGLMHLHFHSGPAGNIEIGPDSEMAFLGGTVEFDQPVTIQPNGLLRLRTNWSSSSQITVDGGVVRLERTATEHGDWVWQNGGTLEIANGIQPADLIGMDTTSATQILFNSGALFLDGESFDLATIPGQWTLGRAQIENGTLTGLPGGNAWGNESDQLILNDVTLDMPLQVEAGQVRLSGTSAIAQPLTLTGGTTTLFNEWSNPGGIVVSGARLELDNLPAETGSIVVNAGELAITQIPPSPLGIVFNGGMLETQFHTTLTELAALPWTPDTIAVGLRVNQFGSLDLEGATLDVAGQPWAFTLRGGTVSNGVLWKSTDDGPWQIERGNFRDLTLQTDVETQQQVNMYNDIAVEGSRLVGDFWAAHTTSLTLDGVTLDGTLTVGTSHGSPPPVEANNLTVNGLLKLGTRMVHMQGPQTLAGTGVVVTDGIRGASGGGFEVTGGNLTLEQGFTFRSERNGSRLSTDWVTIDNHGTIIAAEDDYNNGADVLAPAVTLKSGNGVQGAFNQRGRLQVADDYEIRVETINFYNHGEIEIRGGLLTAATRQLQNDGVIRGDGTLVQTGNRFWNRGEIIVGNHGVEPPTGDEPPESPGTTGLLTVVGDLAQLDQGVLRLDIAGTVVGDEYDRLIVAGSATLDGLLEVSLLGGFTPALDQSFELMTATDGFVGEFAQVDLPQLVGDLAWELVYGPTTLTLAVVATPLPGDYNGDGSVTAADYQTWRDAFGSTTDLAADGNGNGTIDVADYTVWRDAMQQPPQAVLGSAVPEPASLVLLASLLVVGKTMLGRQTGHRCHMAA